MSGPNLLQEFAGSLISKPTADWLERQMSIPIYKAPALCGRALVRTDGNLFEFDTMEGFPALIVPCGWRGEGGYGWNTLSDIIAFRPGQPAQWSWRMGTAPLLGPDQAERARAFGEPLALYTSPMDWLRALGAGSVILDWSRYLPLWLQGIEPLVCDTTALAMRLRANLVRSSGRCPEIRVLKQEGADAVAA